MSSFKIKKSLNLFYWIFYAVANFLLYPVVLVFFKVRIYGYRKFLDWRKNHKNSFIVIARHKSFWDVTFPSVAFGSKPENLLNYIAKANIGRYLRFIPFLNNYVIYVDRENFKVSTFKKIIKILKEGGNIAIFPEGTTVPQSKKPNRGVIQIIRKAEKLTNEEIPIFPLNIKAKGPYGKPKGKWFYYLLGKVKIELRIGNPIYLKNLESRARSKNLFDKNQEKMIVEKLLREIDKT